MATRRIERLGLDGTIVERLKEKGFMTLKDLLAASPLTLMLSLDVSLNEAENMQRSASAKAVADRSRTALELLQARAQQRIYLPTGVAKLDATMNGGLNVGTITEISGPPGVGKTQFCIGCCVEAIARSHAMFGGTTRSGVLYIDTEHKFDCTRLSELAYHRYPNLYSENNHEVDLLLGSIKVMRPSSCKELYELVSNLQPLVISQNISLVRVCILPPHP